MNTTRTSQTAILLFANTSREEVKRKAIYGGASLFDVLTTHTLETIETTGLPYFHFSEEQQTGTTFGERFSNAIQAIYSRGYQHVITIGNDSPLLRPEHIFEAEEQLNNNKFVLGPSVDGGFYLMGLHQDLFDATAFKKLSWQTPELARQLLDLVSRSREVFCLPLLYDIDTIADVKVFLSRVYRIPNKIRRALLCCLASSRPPIYQLDFFVGTPQRVFVPTRGSPLLCQAAYTALNPFCS